MAEQLWSKSAGELAALIAAGETSSREVVDAHLDRIAAVNGRVNAVVEVLTDQARAAADAADAHQKSGKPLGRLHGVPFTIKTNIDYTGSPTHEGAESMKDLIAPSDAPVVERMKGAGGVPIGRTNMPDFGLRINTVSSLFGATHNPWDYERTAGGSSGGEGAAIASGMSPIGLGNDIGGSVRNPAFCNGIASIKPSIGRIPAGNETAAMNQTISAQIMLDQGILARRVADVRAGLEIVMGAHPRDPFAVDAPLGGAPASKRVALVTHPEGGSTHPSIAEGVKRAGDALSRAGYEVEEVMPPLLIESYLAWSELIMADTAMSQPILEMVMGKDGLRFLELTNGAFPPPTVESMFANHQLRDKVARAWQAFFFDYPLIVGPTWTQPPFHLGFDLESADTAMQVAEIFRFVLPANLMGLPAACVPTGVIDGLPVGAQIMSRRFREDLCLDAAEAIERDLGIITPIDPR